MRILTWNVERPALKSPKNDQRVAHLLSLQPDIALLTETSTAVDLTPAYNGILTEPSSRKPRPGEAVAAIWFRDDRFELIQRIDTSDPREAVCVQLDSDLGPLLVYASIIPWHGWKGPHGSSAPWEEHKKAIHWHCADWVRLRGRLADHHFIAGGDFNQTRSGAGGYGTAETRLMLRDTLAAANLICVTEEDFRETRGLSRHCIDHICLSPQLAAAVENVDVWEGTLDGVRLSDHNGVFVDVRL